MIDGLILEAGYSCARDHGSGVWYQKAYPYVTDLCSPTFEVGYRICKWTFGYAHLLRTSSDAIATTCDVGCADTSRFVTSGKVDGLYARYEWRHANWIAEAGVLVFRPQHTVRAEFLDATFVNEPEVRVTPSVGIGYDFSPFSLMARFYPAVKSAGDRRSDNGGYTSLSSLYSGPVLTMSVRYEF